MPQRPDSVLLCALDSDFFEYASFYLTSLGIRTIPVLAPELVDAAVAAERPGLVLYHWDTLGDAALTSIAVIRAAHGAQLRLAVLSDKLNGGVSAASALAQGADDVIEGAHNPRIFLTRIKALLTTREHGEKAHQLTS